MPSNSTNGWTEWSKYVLKELERLNACYDSLNEKVGKISNDIMMLKVKSGVWGAIAGLIPVVIALVLWALSQR